MLAGHHPMLASLTVGHFLVREPGQPPIRFSTSGGFVEVQRDRVTVLAETAIPADKIDVARAEAARDRALERLKGKRKREEEVDIARAEAALARAINRLKAVSEEK